MSTSIQEQDLIQTIKELQQRVNDLERQQRTIAISTGGIEKAVRVRRNLTNTEYQQMEMDSFSINYSYVNNNDPNLQIDGGIVANLKIDGIDIFNVGDFAPGILNLYDLSPAINNHGTDIPTTTTSTGVKGQIKWNASHLYVCTATNTWRRVALSTW